VNTVEAKPASGAIAPPIPRGACALPQPHGFSPSHSPAASHSSWSEDGSFGQHSWLQTAETIPPGLCREGISETLQEGQGVRLRATPPGTESRRSCGACPGSPTAQCRHPSPSGRGLQDTHRTVHKAICQFCHPPSPNMDSVPHPLPPLPQGTLPNKTLRVSLPYPSPR
jgi:hypothetical protein